MKRRRTPPRDPATSPDVLRSPGASLDDETRTVMSARFGHDLSAVRVHTDADAAASAEALQADAYTVGPHIAFGAAQYAPGTAEGDRLLAHELAHVVQQGTVAVPSGRLAVSSPSDAAEQQADRAAAGGRVPETGTAPVKVQRLFGSAVRHSTLRGADAVIPLDRFVAHVEEVERANPKDRPSEILSRLRVQYYGGEGLADFAAFSQLIPDADAYDGYSAVGPSGIPSYVSSPKTLGNVSADARSHLLSRADENAPGDNPSPYLLLPGGEQVDVGHLFLAMDALFHSRSGEPYLSYGVPNIDVSGWVADVGIASVWMTMAEDGHPHGDDPVARAGRPRTVEEYFRASAPDQDLLGDIDAFRMKQQWDEHRDTTLSGALRRYYAGGAGSHGVDVRYATFCARAGIGYSVTGGAVTWSNRDMLIKQIDRFNDLYGAGSLGTAWGTVFGPSHRAWPRTPIMLDRFLDGWLRARLEAELKGAPTGSRP